MPDWSDTSHGYRARPTVVSVRHGDATVLLDPSTGNYYTLNGPGAFIWDQVCENKSIADISSALRLKYDVEPESSEHDVTAFVRSLAKRNLLVSIPN